ncbi:MULTISPECIES: hypothetical protein [Clostridium]|jgi:hypothetical protein|uniref:hypothetical protein n=1 Tax=Clostridium TaxID=1485 RepID=UPI001C84FC8A|nr:MULTISPECIES: hypothetical protein [Clostridium]MDU4427625.1 hypothetical protein [Clostridium sp.]MDU7458766.1 hypothetical protein [Clostridium perfringens]
MNLNIEELKICRIALQEYNNRIRKTRDALTDDMPEIKKELGNLISLAESSLKEVDRELFGR